MKQNGHATDTNTTFITYDKAEAWKAYVNCECYLSCGWESQCQFWSCPCPWPMNDSLASCVHISHSQGDADF